MREHVLPYWGNYARLALLAGIVMALLCVTQLVWPGLIHWLFRIDSTNGADVMSGRAAMLYLGLAIIALQSRHATDGPLRRTVSLGIGATMAGLLCVGLYDYFTGAVGHGIWLAILPEAFFATGFLRFWRGKADLDRGAN